MLGYIIVTIFAHQYNDQQKIAAALLIIGIAL